MQLGTILACAAIATTATFCLAFAFADRMGAASRRRIEAKFAKALRENATKTMIGFTPWTIAPDGFRPIAVDAGGRGLLYSAERSRDFRVVEEREKYVERQGGFVAFAGTMGFWGLAPLHGPLWMAIIPALAALPALWFLVIELAFRFGYQRMQGAMVLDPDLTHLQSQEVRDQKAHGQARYATAAEIDAAAAGAVRRSRVHHQEF